MSNVRDLLLGEMYKTVKLLSARQTAVIIPTTRSLSIAYYVGPNMWNNIVVRHNLHNCLSIRVFKKEIFRVISDILS